MIARLTGTLVLKSPEYIVLDVNGVGYGIYISLYTFYELPESGVPVTLLIYTHMREDAIKLYGFLTLREKLVFEQLIGISKIGPKLARNILSKLSVEELESAILKANAGLIHSIPGIGEKTAQRLILELKDKIHQLSTSEPMHILETKTEDKESCLSDAVSALINLGYSKRESQKAVRAYMSAHLSEPFTLKDVIKHSLDILSS